MNVIHVNASKSYDVLIGKDIFYQAHTFISNISKSKNIAIITDDNVDRLYSEALFSQLHNDGFNVAKYVFLNGEKSKNVATYASILEFLATNNFKRNDCLIALGGGVVGDLTGFVASTYMRGINFVQIPTTLLSMVDASIGGKTAIDLKAGKNLAGSFWQPSLVVCDVNIINNLPKDIFIEGMAEVLKYDIIRNVGIFDIVLNNKLDDELEAVIYKCIKIKQEIVDQDEFETTGLRKLLNVGHTFAHSLEKLSKYKISHGYAVGTGLVYEAAIAYYLGMCSIDLVSKIKKGVKCFDLLVDFDYSFKSLVEAMKNDKKNDNSLISFILPNKMGDCEEKKISDIDLIGILNKVGDIL
ncbi:MAG: 3-dehydroquinate synthase [Erysipelotrichaceae bacterium]|jgi:3-dehydroquinate synthase|nr:3-dehydroquinate synthase [Erysipelotrichaceae bacterium]